MRAFEDRFKTCIRETYPLVCVRGRFRFRPLSALQLPHELFRWICWRDYIPWMQALQSGGSTGAVHRSFTEFPVQRDARIRLGLAAALFPHMTAITLLKVDRHRF